MRRTTAVLLLLALALLALPAAASAGNPDLNIDIGDPGDQFVVKGRIALAPGERADSLVTIDGPITVPRGASVSGDVLAVDGDVRIAGRVDGDVVTGGGRATIERTAVVGGGVSWVSERPAVAPGARIDDGVDKVDLDVGKAFPFVAWIWWWIALSVSSLALGLLLLWLAPRAADALAARMRDGGWGPAVGVGFVIFLLAPVLAVLALITLVGIPFGIGLLLALLPLGALGYVTGAWVLGRALVGPPSGRAVAFLAGWAILRAVALIPVFGGLGFLAAMVVGLGALGWTLWQVRGAGTTGGAGGAETPAAPAV